MRGLLSCEPDSPAAVLLKAQLETSKQQPRKALKTLGPLLATAHQHTIRWVDTLYHDTHTHACCNSCLQHRPWLEGLSAPCTLSEVESCNGYGGLKWLV